MMTKKSTIGMLMLSLLLLGACGQQDKQVTPSSVSKASAVGSPSNSSKAEASSKKEQADQKATQEATKERTEPNPPMPPEVVEQLIKERGGEEQHQVEETKSEPRQAVRKLLPVTHQLQQVWNYCAPTTVSMLLSYRGVNVSQFQLAKEMGTYEPFGTHNRDAIRILNKHLFGYEVPTDQQAGYRLATVTDASPTSEDLRLFKERVRKNIDEGYPLYYTFTVAQIYPGKKGEHNVLGMGYELTADGKDVAAVYYLDPDKHVQDPVYGGLYKLSPEELLAAMVTCEEPNYAW